MRTILKNGTVITPERKIEGGVVFKNSRIKKVFTSEEEIDISNEDKVIDVKGCTITPGFIDIHTHGGGGYDFMDGKVEDFKGASKAHMEFGTTSIIPTTLTSTKEETYNILDNFNQAKKEMKQGPEILGLHLEGPYFAHEQKGAQDPRYIRNPDPEEYNKILSACPYIVRWTAAPELEGALEMGRKLKKRGILAAVGHSNAVFSEVQEAFENGYEHITHLYSGMSSVRRINAYRYSGVVESAYLIDDLTVEIIADGCHLPASLLKLIYKIKGPNKIALITDSMRGAGMPEGKYIIGSKKEGQEVIVEEGVAKLKDRSAFAGSVATADRLVRTMVELAEVPLKEAVKMMTLTPAQIMGIDSKKGILGADKDADIVVFDKDIKVKMVICSGEVMVNKF
ncbi:MAG: N-acetylglucosamine-6-phosphate deacetylase [Halanaerobiaceae bacterium]